MDIRRLIFNDFSSFLLDTLYKNVMIDKGESEVSKTPDSARLKELSDTSVNQYVGLAYPIMHDGVIC